MNQALDEQRRHRELRLGDIDILVARGLISERDLASALSVEFDLPFVDLAAYPVNAGALTALPAEIILKYHALPIDIVDGALIVALADPLAVDALDAVRLNWAHTFKQVVSTPSQLDARITALLHPPCLRRVVRSAGPPGGSGVTDAGGD